MKPPKGADVERVYPHGRMGTGTDPKPTAADDLDDDARWQAEEDAAAELIAREASAPRVVEPNSIDAADLAHRVPFDDDRDLIADRPSAAEAHAADLERLSRGFTARIETSEARAACIAGQLEQANASIVTMARSLSRFEAERRAWASKLAEAQRPRQHRIVSSLLTLLRGDR